MGEILEQLINYTEIHFVSEEKWMDEVSYPDLERHKARHRQLVHKVVKFRHEYFSSGRRITGNMMEFLKYWLTKHILVADKEFGEFYLRATGATIPD